VREKLARASDIKELLDLSSNARVYELARRGILPGVVRIGRQVRFDMAKVASFIEKGGLAPAAASQHGPVQVAIESPGSLSPGACVADLSRDEGN
jgi:hypothetical protein